jgi:hypothetical protein
VQKIILAYDAYDREQAAKKYNAESRDRDRRDPDRREDRRDGDHAHTFRPRKNNQN